MTGAVEGTPRISVVTPSYNQGVFLDATLRSVVEQDYPDLEYVVIDGGSTDDSVDIITRHQQELDYWVSEPDEGHAHAINKGFARTSGEIMSWINSSDMYYPWTFRTVAEVFSQLPDVDWITGVGSQFGVDGRPKVVASTVGLNVYDVLGGNYRWIQQESVFWRRSLWEKAGGRLDESLTCAADFDLWLRFFRLTPLHVVDTLLGGFRVHEERLGESGDGLYEREAAMVHSRFVSSFDRKMLSRARLVRRARFGKLRIVEDGLRKTGRLPWYRHPHVVFDFKRGSWTLR